MPRPVEVGQHAPQGLRVLIRRAEKVIGWKMQLDINDMWRDPCKWANMHPKGYAS